MPTTVDWPHELYGGWLCLDFANTLDARGMQETEENLHSYSDLLQWAAYADVVSPAGRARLLRRAHRDPDAASVVLVGALELREAIYRVFRGVADGLVAPRTDRDGIRDAFAVAASHGSLAAVDDGYAWHWPEDDLASIWWPIAASAVELLTAGPVERVKVCASDEGCAGLFLDLSKNRSRRWCSMASCGVEAKIKQQHAARRRAAAATH